MKRIVVALLTLTLFGCSMSVTPSSKVESYLDKYTSLSEEVLTDLEITVLNEDLNSENRELYKNVLKREYENLKYEIKDETINGDKANVRVRVTVYDLYKVEEESLNYLANYPEDFQDSNGLFDNDEFNKYRLNQMFNAKDTVDYEIIFYLNKINGEWIMQELDRDSLEKIHGMYNYKND